MLKTAINAPLPNKKTEGHLHTFRGRQDVENDECNPNFSEITTGLSECAYGCCSPLTQMVKSTNITYNVRETSWDSNMKIIFFQQGYLNNNNNADYEQDKMPAHRKNKTCKSQQSHLYI